MKTSSTSTTEARLAVAVVDVTMTLHALQTQALGQESGSTNTPHYVLSVAVAMGVSGGNLSDCKSSEHNFAVIDDLSQRCCELAKLPQQLS